MARSPTLPSPGTTVGGAYVLRKLLGQGGMGAVFEAERGGDLFALKLLLAGSTDPVHTARFLREGKAASSLETPYVVPVLDVGVDESIGFPYLVMPLLRGRDLADQLAHGPLHPTVAARLIAQAASGLVVAHKASVIHRDIKPANIFLDIHEGVVTARICDFGIAKIHEESDQTALTKTGTGMGSPAYMPPEQLANAKRADARADLWSLGMSLYEALAGAAPFANLTGLAELILKLTSEDVPHIQDAAPWVEPEIATVVHGLLLRDREKRCPSAQALRDALLSLTGGSLTVTEAMLAPLPDEVRRSVAPRAQRTERWQTFEIAATVRDPRVGQLVGGKFKLSKLIGRGGMGDVYEGTGPTGEVVAVKVMAPAVAQDANSKRRFVRELRAAMAIRNPHVVRVIDAESDPAQGAPYMAMEMLRGTDLNVLLKEHGPLEPAAACKTFMQACEGLSAAHALGIVHRDIKPANIFLHEQEGGEITVKICDFGIAKETLTADDTTAATDLTKTGGLIGTALYMSPEQARNAKSVDHRTDIWSLSISLYEALSGKKPWGDASAMGEIIIAICTSDLPPLQNVAPWVDGQLAQVVHRGLRREPGDRWGSMAEFAAALRPFCEQTPLSRRSLSSLSVERRSVVAPRASIPTDAGAITNASTSADKLQSQPPVKRSGATLAVAAVAALALGGFGLTRLADSTQAKANDAQKAGSASAPSAPPTPQLVKGNVKVKPTTAQVSVRGKPVEIDAQGNVALEAEPGDPVEVSVTVGAETRKTRVLLSRNGEAQPAEIDASPPPTASVVASGAAQPPAAKSPGKQAPTKATATTTAAPPTTATTPGKVKPKEGLD